MSADKDHPSTWVKYRKGLCEGCVANCCAMPVEIMLDDLLRLNLISLDEAQGSQKKIAKRLIKEGYIRSYREGTKLFMLESSENGDCIFLDKKTRLCTVYDKRPYVCREFPLVGPRPGYCPAGKK